MAKQVKQSKLKKLVKVLVILALGSVVGQQVDSRVLNKARARSAFNQCVSFCDRNAPNPLAALQCKIQGCEGIIANNACIEFNVPDRAAQPEEQ